MKKITGLLIASVFVGAVLSSCGDKYVPLTEEQKRLSTLQKRS